MSRKKADKIRKRLIDVAVREAIALDRPRTIAACVIRRAQYDHPEKWFAVAAWQLCGILRLSPGNADTLISEMCSDRLIIS